MLRDHPSRIRTGSAWKADRPARSPYGSLSSAAWRHLVVKGTGHGYSVPVPLGISSAVRRVGVQLGADVVREGTEHLADAGVRDLLGRVLQALGRVAGRANVRGDLRVREDAGLLGFEGGDPLLGGATHVLPLGGSFGRRGNLHFLRVVHDELSFVLRLEAGESDVCSPLFVSILPLPVRTGKGIHQISRVPLQLETASERVERTDHPIPGRRLARAVRFRVGRGHRKGDRIEKIVRGRAVRADVGPIEGGEDGIPLVLRPAGNLCVGHDFQETVRHGRDFRQRERHSVPHVDAIRQLANLLLGVLPRLDRTLDPLLHDRRMIFVPGHSVRDREIVRTRQEGGKHVLAPGTVGNEFPLGLASVVRIDENHVVNKFLTDRQFDPARVETQAKDFHGLPAIRQETAREHGIGRRPSRIAEVLHLGRDVHQGHGSVGLGNVFRTHDPAIVRSQERVLVLDRSVRLGVDGLDPFDPVVPLGGFQELGQARVQLVGQGALDGHADARSGIVLGVEERHGFLLLASHGSMFPCWR